MEELNLWKKAAESKYTQIGKKKPSQIILKPIEGNTSKRMGDQQC